MTLTPEQMSTLHRWGTTPPNDARTLRAFLGDMNGVMSGSTEIFDTSPSMGAMLQAQNGNFGGLINDGSMAQWVEEIGGPAAASEQMAGMVTQMGGNTNAILAVLDNPNERNWNAPSQQMFAAMMHDLRSSDPALVEQLSTELRADIASGQTQTAAVSVGSVEQSPSPVNNSVTTPAAQATQSPTSQDPDSFFSLSSQQQERLAAFLDAEVTITNASGTQESVSRGSLIASALENISNMRDALFDRLGVPEEFRAMGDRFWNRVQDGLDQAGIEPVPSDQLPGGSVLRALGGREDNGRGQETIYTQADYDQGVGGRDLVAAQVAAGVSPDNTPGAGIQRGAGVAMA